MSGAYYNEFKPEAAAMLRQLIKDGHIADGEVDERSITEVKADELTGFTQCHFFAGIGGWSVALRLAGWPDDRPVWTGSCPCQPFSVAGRRKAQKDEHHLWPVWFDLIRECKPSKVFGEQVSSAISHGWLDGVYVDLEAEGYACGSAVLPACAVDAPHKRERDAGLWPTPRTNTGGPDNSSRKKRPSGHQGTTNLAGAALAALRPTPRTSGEETATTKIARSKTGLPLSAMALWLTPSASEDAAGTVNGKMQTMLTHQAKLAAFGTTTNGSSAPTGKRGASPQLNPAFVSWLMGYSTAHHSSMVLAMQLCRKKPRASSSRAKQLERTLSAEGLI